MSRILLLFILLTACLGATEARSIAIFTYRVDGAEPWDPDSINRGITGSEEAVIFMAKELANLGYTVQVYGILPEGSKHSRCDLNPRYLHVDQDDARHFDIAIAWRQPRSAAKLKKRADVLYLWPHDTLTYEVADEEINGFDDVLWLSNTQRTQWISKSRGFEKFTYIFGNGIDPSQFGPIKPKPNPYSCIYSSNYARGLDILLDIWPEVHKSYPKATLDIYYGWNHWGQMSPEKEAKMRKQVADYKELGVTEHGLVGHQELNLAFEKASFWTYPCTKFETFCITAIRAEVSGCMPVILEHSALRETVPYAWRTYNRAEYLGILLQALSQAEVIAPWQREKLRDFVLENYTWKKMAAKWSDHFSKKFQSQKGSIKESPTQERALEKSA